MSYGQPENVKLEIKLNIQFYKGDRTISEELNKLFC